MSVSQRRVFDAMYASYRERKLGVPDLQWLYPVYELSKAQVVASLPAADRTVERIGDLLAYDFQALVKESR